MLSAFVSGWDDSWLGTLSRDLCLPDLHKVAHFTLVISAISIKVHMHNKMKLRLVWTGECFKAHLFSFSQLPGCRCSMFYTQLLTCKTIPQVTLEIHCSWLPQDTLVFGVVTAGYHWVLISVQEARWQLRAGCLSSFTPRIQGMCFVASLIFYRWNIGLNKSNICLRELSGMWER